MSVPTWFTNLDKSLSKDNTFSQESTLSRHAMENYVECLRGALRCSSVLGQGELASKARQQFITQALRWMEVA